MITITLFDKLQQTIAVMLPGTLEQFDDWLADFAESHWDDVFNRKFCDWNANAPRQQNSDRFWRDNGRYYYGRCNVMIGDGAVYAMTLPL